ncbi:hypothetical protein DLE01_12615, partial [Streptomyces sp. FT05W]
MPTTVTSTGAPVNASWEDLVSAAVLGTDRRPLRTEEGAAVSPTKAESSLPARWVSYASSAFVTSSTRVPSSLSSQRSRTVRS